MAGVCRYPCFARTILRANNNIKPASLISYPGITTTISITMILFLCTLSSSSHGSCLEQDPFLLLLLFSPSDITHINTSSIHTSSFKQLFIDEHDQPSYLPLSTSRSHSLFFIRDCNRDHSDYSTPLYCIKQDNINQQESGSRSPSLSLELIDGYITPSSSSKFSFLSSSLLTTFYIHRLSRYLYTQYVLHPRAYLFPLLD